MHANRKVILINKPFQLKFCLYVCSWLIALSIAYPLILSNLFDTFIRYLALDPSGPTLAYLEKARREIIWLMVGMQAVLVTLTFLISVFMSHRIAGPLYRLQKTFQESAAGNLEKKLSFRERDYFQELAAGYNAMIDAIRIRIGKTSRAIEVAIPRLEKALEKAPSELKPELETALLALRQSQKN